MQEESRPESAPLELGPRVGFIADLAFVLGVVWLAVWRGELSGAPPGSIWAGFSPAWILGGLVVVAVLVGLGQRRPRGFLPYWLRWCFLAASLVLPAWIALSVADAGDAALTIRGAANELRRSAEETLAAPAPAQQGNAPERDAQEHEARKAREAAEAAEKLAATIEKAEERGIEVPRKDLTELGVDPADVAAMDPATRKTLEQAAGVAAVQEGTLPAPPGFADLAREIGLDNPVVRKAVIALAAALLAPLLGLSPALVGAVLAALLEAGDLSVENLLQVGVALAASRTSSGNFSAAKFKKNYANLGELRVLYNALTAKGVDPARLEFLDGKTEKSDQGACLTKAAQRLSEPDPKEYKRLLRQACPAASPSEIDRIVKDRR